MGEVEKQDGGGEAFPAYRELGGVGTPPGSSWGIFEDLGRGTLGFVQKSELLTAFSECLGEGPIGLDANLGWPNPTLAAGRVPTSVELVQHDHWSLDDYISEFYLGASSHIDSLRHLGHPRYGFYGGSYTEGMTKSDAVAKEDELGTDALGRDGIVTRAVLIDAEEYWKSTNNRSLDHTTAESIDLEALRQILQHQAVDVRKGDALLIRTGFTKYYNGLSTEERHELRSNKSWSGIEASEEMLEWLWECQISLVASDNPTVESYPPSDRTNPRFTYGDGHRHNGMLHPTLIALLGFILGEWWDLERLSPACHETGKFSCILMSKPMNLAGAASSPANAIAMI